VLTSTIPGLTCARPGLGALTCCLQPANPCPLCSLQVKANKNSPHLSRLQECSRTVNERAANVVASTKSGQEQIEDRGELLGIQRGFPELVGGVTHS
jgi:hypothetical protein